LASITVRRFVLWLSVAQAFLHLGAAVAFAITAPFHLYTLCDFVSVALLFLGALGALRWGWALGIVCAGWAFELAIYLRAVLARLESVLGGDDQLLLQLAVLGAWLLVVVLGFALSARLCIADSTHHAGGESVAAV
jgi:hypothetical protein